MMGVSRTRSMWTFAIAIGRLRASPRFESCAGLARDGRTQPELKIGFAASANLFEAFRVVPTLGRPFRADENRVPRRDAVVILGEALWRRDFSADPSIIGRQVRLNGTDFEVVGVVPDAFDGLFDLARPTFFVPLMMAPVRPS
jgi:putative ABC transport system permease protein